MLSAVLVLWDIMWWAEVPMNQQSWLIQVGWLVAHQYACVCRCCHMHLLHLHASASYRTHHAYCTCLLLRWTMSIGRSCCSVSSTRSGRSTRVHTVCIHLLHPSVCNPCMYMLATPYPHMQPSAPLHACDARHLLAAGVLEGDDKKPQEEFSEMVTIGGIPELPEGYMITQWLRFAAPSLPT